MSIFENLLARLEAVPLQMQITSSEPIGSHIQKVTLAYPRGQAKEFPIGSYIQPMIAGCIPRAYSIVEATDRNCTIIVSTSGRGVGARFFENAPVGTPIESFGPFSDFPYRYGTGRSKIFLATGTGVAPFVRMIPEAIHENLPALLALGVPEERDIPYRAYLESLSARTPSFHCLFVLSRASKTWEGPRGYITDQFEGTREEWLRASDVYVCGIPAMTEGTRELLRRVHVPRKQIFVQKFG